jgi:UDP-glucuronate 4-epimerase
MRTIGLRFFTVYGEWGRPDMAYWSFLENIIHGQTLKVFNYGANKRDFTYIEDVTRGVVSALFSKQLQKYEIINLGNHKPVELMDFISILEKLTGIEAIKEMVPAQPGDVVSTYADITLASQKLGFEPYTDLEPGLERFVRWYKDNRDLAMMVRDHRLKQVGP